MRVSGLHAVLLLLASTASAFVVPSNSLSSAAYTSTQLSAKYNTMDEILAKFPEDKPILINFYDANTENAIKSDIFKTKEMLKDRATLVSIKRQDYPEIAKLWDADTKSPAMILFKDGQPVKRLYEETDYLEIITRIGPLLND